MTPQRRAGMRQNEDVTNNYSQSNENRTMASSSQWCLGRGRAEHPASGKPKGRNQITDLWWQKSLQAGPKLLTFLEDSPVPTPKSKALMCSSTTCFSTEVCQQSVFHRTQAHLKPSFKPILVHTIPMVTDLFQILHVIVTDFLQRILSQRTGVY